MDELSLGNLLQANGPTHLVVKAIVEPVAGFDRFQPAGFPEVGHVLYEAPRAGNCTEKVCIVDSPASMANHLETVCLMGPNDPTLHADLTGLPYVACVSDRKYVVGDDGKIVLDPKDPHDRVVCTTLTEGHRLASDYFLDALVSPRWKEETGEWQGTVFRSELRRSFGLVEVKKDKMYFTYPDNWWSIYTTIFRCDPNSLVHGVLFAREQIKVSRLLSAHMEAFGAARVGRSGVKFDRLGKTISGQPIFAVDEETAREIRATFILDLALLRSYGRGADGLSESQKRLVLELAMWKVRRLLEGPFRFRSGCHLACRSKEVTTDSGAWTELPTVDIQQAIGNCGFPEDAVRSVYYPANELFEVKPEAVPAEGAEAETPEEEGED